MSKTHRSICKHCSEPIRKLRKEDVPNKPNFVGQWKHEPPRDQFACDIDSEMPRFAEPVSEPSQEQPEHIAA